MANKKIIIWVVAVIIVFAAVMFVTQEQGSTLAKNATVPEETKEIPAAKVSTSKCGDGKCGAGKCGATE